MEISKVICDYCNKAIREDGEDLTDVRLRISFASWPTYRWKTSNDSINFRMSRLDGDYCDIGCFIKEFKKLKTSIEKECGK